MTMKKIYRLFAFATLAAVVTGCANEEENDGAAVAASGNVEFVTRTPQPASARGPVYTADEFRILAFRDAGSGYVYQQEIPLAGMTFTQTTLKGSAQLPAGVYKFLPSYGLVTPGNYAWPDLTNAALSDALYVTHTQGSFPAVFMLNEKLDDVPAYTVSLDGPKQTVSATLRRAVSRVDVLFIRAEKDPATGAYKEVAGDDVFGPEKLASARFSYTDANSRLGLSGEKVDGVFDPVHTVTASDAVLTIGTGAATTVGADKYDFENVQPADIISGSAHLKGTYLIPNADNAATAKLELLLTSGENNTRTITLSQPIPVERNKVTLIRVYVLGDNVFTTKVDFAVEVDTAWDGSNVVDEEID